MFSESWKLDGRNWKKSSLQKKPVVLRIQKSCMFKAPGGSTVNLNEGDTLVVLKKSDKDWWQVRKVEESETTKPFHAPSSYISQLILEKNKEQRSKDKEGIKHFTRSQENLLFFSSVPSTMDDQSYLKFYSGESLTPTIPPSSKHKKSASFSLSSSWHGYFPKCEKEKSPFYKSVSEKVSLANPMQENPVYSNLEEMKMGKGIPPSPTHPPIHMIDNWECHFDPLSGRNFYINTETKEKTWKPPRKTRDHTPGRADTLPKDVESSGEYDKYQIPRTPFMQVKGEQISDPTLEQHSISPLSSSQSFGSLHRISNDGQLDGEKPLLPKLTYTKSMILSNSRVSKANHRRNLSQSNAENYSDTTAELHRVPVVTVLDVPHEVEKASQLNKTKIAEGGRKLKKNWSASWVVLTGNSLMFYKDPKVLVPSGWKPSNSKPESSVDLRGATIDSTQEMSSKKNVIHLRMVTGNEYLLQSDKDLLIQEWYDALQRVIERLDRENPLDDIILRRAGSVEVLDGSGGEEESPLKTKDNRKFSLSWVSSNPSDKKKVRTRLKKLLVRRPPLQTLQEKGLIKDQVFGCRLDALCHRENSTVPKFVCMCIEAVNERGLEADGIYRVNGNLATIQKLRFIVDREEKLDLSTSDWEDVHVITGALKMFFRELPEPLIPFSMFEQYVEAVQIPDLDERIETIKDLVSTLPEPNHDTLKHMLSHLKRVMEHSETNRMTTQNIGIVFGPTLMRPEKELFSNIAANMVYQNQVVEHFLTYYEELFSDGPEE
ncbi:rho GTPase-activating protein 9 isoform X2 [Xenopus tropicalis]|uniref:Rho GTPase-activating protein 9 n=1 Tax=Xenopus tropicalis TaxID=8364 RepID=A0A6I8QBC0_XENTR|nr:rho GTPase-activating protein 9 isoform X2 [Xenopus tropicalis]